MRILLGAFWLICGSIVIALVGYYGHSTTDDPVAAWIVAFMYAAIATGGLFGHAVAIRIWRTNKLWSVIGGLVCSVALILNLSNSLGAIAGRSDKTNAARTQAADALKADRVDLARLEDSLNALGKFTPTDEEAVNAARRAADTATANKQAECTKRGPNCRQRELDEAAAATALATVSANKSTTDRASKLEAELKDLRARMAATGPVQSTNVQATAVAKLFRLPDTEAGFVGVVNQLGIAAIVEILIMLSGVFFELLGREAAKTAAKQQPKLAQGRQPRMIDASAEEIKPSTRGRAVLSLVPTEQRAGRQRTSKLIRHRF